MYKKLRNDDVTKFALKINKKTIKKTSCRKFSKPSFSTIFPTVAASIGIKF